MSDALYQLPAHAVAGGIQRGDFTAKEVTQSYLGRIESLDSRVKAYVDVWPEYALKRAEAVDAERGKSNGAHPLAGVPVGLKDLLCTTEGTTTCCSKILEGFRSPFDGTAVKKLEAAGAIVLGKLNMDEFAMGSSTENSAVAASRNPWNLDCVPGGSSGGSAAAVAADLAALTLGSDTGGSIRQPAALCGCIGMKPTYGRVSRSGLVAFASSLDQIGPFTKDVRDLALSLNAICGRDVNDATSADVPVPDFTDALRSDVKGLRIGIPKEFFPDDLSAEVRGPVETAIDALKGQGAELVDVSLPNAQYGIAVYYIICTAEASANLARFDGVRYGFRHPEAEDMASMYTLSKSEGFGPEVKRRIMLGTYVLSSGYYDAYYLKAQKVRSLIRRDYDAAFEHCDVIATPTTPTPAFKIGEKSDDPLQMYLSDIFTTSVNLAGIPGVSIPCGLSSERLPIGLQLLAKPFDEAALLRTAYTYEQTSGLDMGRPPLD